MTENNNINGDTYVDKEGEWRNKKVTVYEAVGSLIQQMREAPDITRVSMPSVFCHPYSLTEIEGYRNLRKVDILFEAKKMKDPVDRMLKMCYWLLSVIRSAEFQKKPYNPVLGETFSMYVENEQDNQNKTLFFCEQVVHHPPVMASCMENKKEGMRGEFFVTFGAKFHGNSASIHCSGKRTVALFDTPKENEIKKEDKGDKGDYKIEEDKESFFAFNPEIYKRDEKDEKFKIEEMEADKYFFSGFIPNLWMKNVLLGTRRHHWEGSIEIKNPETNLAAILSWKETQEGTFFSPVYKNPVQVLLYQFSDSSLFSSAPHSPLPTNFGNKNPTLLRDIRGDAGGDMFFYEKGKKGELAFSPEKYKENKVKVVPKDKSIPTCSLNVWGKLSNAIANHELKLADQYKREVEQKQREIRKQREISQEVFVPHFFTNKDDNWLFNFDDIKIPINPQQEN